MKEVKIKRGFNEIKSLYSDIAGYGFICGGYARYCLSPQNDPVKPGDVDIFATSEDNYEYIKNLLENKFEKKFESSTAITYKPSSLYIDKEIQLIKPFFENAVNLVENVLVGFDFTVAQAALISPYMGLVSDTFEKDESEKRLVIATIRCPVAILVRIAKYVKKGYKISPVQYLKVFTAWEDLSVERRAQLIHYLNNINNLSQQDHKYLYELIRVID